MVPPGTIRSAPHARAHETTAPAAAAPPAEVLVLMGMLSVIIAADFLRYSLLTLGIDPPFVEGGLLILRLVFSVVGVGLFLKDRFESVEIYNFSLISLLVMLVFAPILGVASQSQEVAFILPYYLTVAAWNFEYVAMGYLLAKRGASLRFAMGLFGIMVVGTLPALLEVAQGGLGTMTAIARNAFHITMGDHFTIVSLLLLGVMRSLPGRLIVVGISLIVMVAVGSRTSLYTYAAVVPVIAFWEYLRGRLSGGTGVLTVVGVLIGLALTRGDVLASLGATRMFSFLATGQDSSWTGRVQAQDVGWQDILTHPLLGSFGSDIIEYGTIGYYIHNYLEMWRQFGLIPFFLFCCLLLVAWLRAMHDLRSRNGNLTFVMLTVVLTIQIVFSRSYGYPQIFMVLGFCSFQMSSMTRGRRLPAPGPGALRPARRSRPISGDAG